MLEVALAVMIGDPQGVPLRMPWISPMDYPAALLQERKEGLVEVELRFDPSGWLMKCTILKSAGASLLDATTCRLSHRRARARPGEPRVQVRQHKWVAPAY